MFFGYGYYKSTINNSKIIPKDKSGCVKYMFIFKKQAIKNSLLFKNSNYKIENQLKIYNLALIQDHPEIST
jgi:hypothetical protein